MSDNIDIIHVRAPSSLVTNLCIKKKWFTCGTNRQYEKLFYVVENGCSIEEIATIIWLCSDCDMHSRLDILAEVEKEFDKYLTNVQSW